LRFSHTQLLVFLAFIEGTRFATGLPTFHQKQVVMQDKQFYQPFHRATAALFCVLTFFTAQSIHAQTRVSKAEVGGQISLIDLRDSIQEKPPGVGGRFTYSFTDYLSFDSEVTYFSTAEVDLNRTQGLFGVKVGRRFGSPSIGLFAA
jgi:hypothetical protein